MIRQMTAPHQSTAEPAEPATEGRTSLLFQVAAAVAIAAGLVFIAAVIFFSGVMAGRASSGFGPPGHRSTSGTCPVMRGDGMTPGGDVVRPTPTPIPAAPGGPRP